ncbi:hypothetical protein AGMMS50239_36700 [Bacteroidia bacterium]|nr:hypothetical protein AGMMS50239_36700 [Bacteroidia bacterium]
MLKKLTNAIIANPDKVLHFVAGGATVLLASIFVDVAMAAVIGFFIAAGKEIYDELSYSGGDLKDFGVTMLGVLGSTASILAHDAMNQAHILI